MYNKNINKNSLIFFLIMIKSNLYLQKKKIILLKKFIMVKLPTKACSYYKIEKQFNFFFLQ